MRILRADSLQVDVALPDQHRHLPNAGYLSQKFTKSLFLRVVLRANQPLQRIPFIELQHIEDDIAFRQRSAHVMERVLAGEYQDIDTSNLQRQPLGQHPTILVPPVWHN
ncbi:unnamed protein product, partial [Strongylus vulgaris]